MPLQGNRFAQPVALTNAGYPPCVAYAKVRTENATDSSFAARLPTATEPTGAGVLDLSQGTTETAGGLLLLPFGTGSNNQTFDLRVVGWKKTPLGLWVPVVLCEASCTLSSTLVGVAGYEAVAADYFADAITVNYGIGVVRQGLGDAQPATLEVDPAGCSKAEVLFDRTGATDCNALWCPL